MDCLRYHTHSERTPFDVGRYTGGATATTRRPLPPQRNLEQRRVVLAFDA